MRCTAPSTWTLPSYRRWDGQGLSMKSPCPATAISTQSANDVRSIAGYPCTSGLMLFLFRSCRGIGSLHIHHG